jgi:hypothetical protein
VIDCGSVSVKHAEMVRVDGGYELRDVGSTNGIKLDGERRDVISLRTGLSVKLGDVAFDFVLTDEEMEALAKEKVVSGEAEADEENDGARDRQQVRPAPRKPVMVHDEAGGGFGMIVLFLILAAAAFFAGMAVRFQKETGNSLLDALKQKPAVSAPAKAAPDKVDAPEAK